MCCGVVNQTVTEWQKECLTKLAVKVSLVLAIGYMCVCVCVCVCVLYVCAHVCILLDRASGMQALGEEGAHSSHKPRLQCRSRAPGSREAKGASRLARVWRAATQEERAHTEAWLRPCPLLAWHYHRHRQQEYHRTSNKYIFIANIESVLLWLTKSTFP